MTAPSKKKSPKPADPSADAMRDQEVVRATRELSAYFRGRRTEREARAALKIIKAFIKDRERTSPAQRRPLPAARTAQRSKRSNIEPINLAPPLPHKG